MELRMTYAKRVDIYKMALHDIANTYCGDEASRTAQDVLENPEKWLKEFTARKSGVAGKIISTVLDTVALEKCCTIRQAFLVDDDALQAIHTRGCLLSHVSRIEVFLDNFVVEKHQQKIPIIDAGNPTLREIKGPITWTGSATGIAIRTQFGNEEFVEKLFNGQKHLVFFVNDEFQWACVNICLTNWLLHVGPKILSLMNPTFMVGRVIGANGQKIYGATGVVEMPAEKR